MHFIYSPLYYADIGVHVFPVEKYRLVAQALQRQHRIPEHAFVAPKAVTTEQLLRVHSQRYLDDLYHCRWTPRTLDSELPLTREIVEMFALACGGTILAAELALRDGAAVHLGGGFHHAFAEKAEGFCYLNDLAVAVRAMLAPPSFSKILNDRAGLAPPSFSKILNDRAGLAPPSFSKILNDRAGLAPLSLNKAFNAEAGLQQNEIQKAVVIDCDLHQGNGTAKIFQPEPSVFTFSIHQHELYPIKEESDLDIHLRNGVGDAEYLLHLQTHIPKILDEFRPELILYQAGADPYEHDQLGDLKLTLQGLAERDRLIFQWAKERQIPIAATLGGGYAYNTADTVAIHANTGLAAWKLWSKD